MPGSMPFHLETGPTLMAIENHLNGTDLNKTMQMQHYRQRLWNARTALAATNGVGRLDQLIASIPTLQAPVPALSGLTPAQAFRKWWLGSPSSGNYDSEATPPTSDQRGKWLNYRGRPEDLLAQLFFEAISLSLGISNDEPQVGETAPTSGTPIDFVCMWKCAQPWLEGWVQSRLDPYAIVITVCTPSDGTFIALAPFGAKPKPKPFRGSFVVTHSQHTYSASTSSSTLTNPSTGAPLPSFGGVFAGVGSIVTVSPALADGGVA